MAWIQSHQKLEKSGKLIYLKKLLRINKYQTIGHLHAFWWWALDNAKDGDISKYGPDIIASASGWDTYVEDVNDPEIKDSDFFKCCISAGFIDQSDEGKFTIHDWKEYTCRYFDLIEKGKEQKIKWREQKRAQRQKNSKCPQNVLVDKNYLSAQCPQMSTPQIREDKRREDKRRDNALSPKDLLDIWNKEKSSSLPRAVSLSTKRADHARARLKEYPAPDFWIDLLKKVNSSPFLCGQNERGWKADFEFILNQNNLIKILEGKYNSTNGAKKEILR